MITTGSITQKDTKGRTWQITIELPKDPITGKRIRKYRTVQGTRKEAERAKFEFIKEIENGIYVDNNKISITEWIQKSFCTIRGGVLELPMQFHLRMIF